jgi:ABC-2 type transport system ATP-binding protein
MPAPVIHASGLRKAYGDVEAVRGIDLEVGEGEIFAFLGPNGAGKTTTVEMLEGYRDRTGGDISVLGIDPGSASRAWRERVGIVLQQCRMRPELTVRETLELYAGYYREPADVGRTIAHVGLDQKADSRAGTLSGGQLRRLDVAVALIGDPDLLFLDEPTTGFDPSARRQMWDVIAGLRELGKTTFLTTHYMDEAQVLADRVAIIVGGRIVAEGPPNRLGREASTTEIRFIADGIDPAAVPLAGAAAARDGRFLVARTIEPVRALGELTAWAMREGHELTGLQVGSPSLEEIYLELTTNPDIPGREAEEMSGGGSTG